MTTPVVSEVDQFAEFFAEAASHPDAEVVAPDDRGAVPPEDAPADAPVPVEPPPAIDAVVPEDLLHSTPADPVDTPQDTDPPDDAAFEQRYRSLQGKFNQREKTLKEQAARIEALETRLNDLPPASPPPQDTAPETPAADPEEDELLATYRENLPEVSRATEVMINRYLKAERERIRQDLLGEITPRLDQMAPVIEHSRLVAQQTHFSAITAAHPDWQQQVESGALQNWIAQQPSYLQPGYRAVIDGGRTDEVIDLLGRFKAETRSTPPTQTPRSTDSRANDALAVRNRAPGNLPASSPDKNDYESAWQEFSRL